jgi:glutaredoxin 3
MNRIEVYSTDNCPWRERAKSLLRARGLDSEEIDIYSDQASALEMTKRSGRRTVPQIFIDNVHIGGFDELPMIDLPDKLDEIHITVTNRGIHP